MSQPVLLTGVDADITIGSSTLTGSRWVYRAHTDFHSAGRLGAFYRTYGIGQTSGIITVQAPWEHNQNPFGVVEVGDTGPLLITVESRVQASCDQVGVESAEVTTDADGMTVWSFTFICMGTFEDFTGSLADGRGEGPNDGI